MVAARTPSYPPNHQRKTTTTTTLARASIDTDYGVFVYRINQGHEGNQGCRRRAFQGDNASSLLEEVTEDKEIVVPRPWTWFSSGAPRFTGLRMGTTGVLLSVGLSVESSKMVGDVRREPRRYGELRRLGGTGGIGKTASGDMERDPIKDNRQSRSWSTGATPHALGRKRYRKPLVRSPGVEGITEGKYPLSS